MSSLCSSLYIRVKNIISNEYVKRTIDWLSAWLCFVPNTSERVRTINNKAHVGWCRVLLLLLPYNRLVVAIIKYIIADTDREEASVSPLVIVYLLAIHTVTVFIVVVYIDNLVLLIFFFIFSFCVIRPSVCQFVCLYMYVLVTCLVVTNGRVWISFDGGGRRGGEKRFLKKGKKFLEISNAGYYLFSISITPTHSL